MRLHNAIVCQSPGAPTLAPILLFRSDFSPVQSFVCQSEQPRDVVVTGIGMVTPLGNSLSTTWHRLTLGERACRALTADEIDHFQQLESIEGLRIAGAPVDHHGIRNSLLEKLKVQPRNRKWQEFPFDAWLSEPVVAMTLHAMMEAAEHAGLHLPVKDPAMSACFAGASKGGLRSAESLVHAAAAERLAYAGGIDSFAAGRRIFEHPPEAEISKLWWHAFQTDAASRAISAISGVQGATSCPVAACATGLVSIIQAASAIHAGQFDVCFAGSADAALRPSVLASFHRLRVTSRNADPAFACKPFDQDRDGFLIGEGCAILVLESRRHAESRGAKPLVRISGGGWLSDPSGVTQIDTSGQVVAELLKRTQHAVEATSADYRPIGYINTHGTGTPSNDLAEANGIHNALHDNLPRCSGFKGAIGHLLGGAGSVESALTMQALQDLHFPGTTNLIQIDRECQIPLLTESWSFPNVQRVAKLSLGFGGHVACALFDREP